MVHGALIVRVIGKLLRQSRPCPVRGADVAGVVQAVGKDVTNQDENRKAYTDYWDRTREEILDRPPSA